MRPRSMGAIMYPGVGTMQIRDRGIEKPDRTVFRLPRIPSLRISLRVPRPRNALSSAIFLAYAFAGLILLGTILLVLPASSRSGQFTSPLDALFTATSAVCITGLVVVDTATHWSAFGQGVLLILIQIGGIGFVTGATLLLLATGRGLGLRSKLLLSESMGMDGLGGVLGIVLKVAIFSVVVEGAGAAVFYLLWRSGGGPDNPLWTAVFQSVSSFNNSGMDIFGNFRSLMDYQSDAAVLLATSALIIVGGLGYLIVEDAIRSRSFARLSLESKLVIIATGSLLAVGTLFFLAAEFSNPATLGPLGFPQKMLVSFFHSVAPRTAGFDAINVAGLRQASLFFTMFLMFVGGAAGSTAGGIKVNTVGVLVTTALSSLKGKARVEAFGRQVAEQTVYRSMALVLCYVSIVGFVVLALSLTEVFPFGDLLFESVSALGTVGLTTGITPNLSIGGRLIIVAVMFIGRLGPLTLVALLVHRQQPADISFPHEGVRIG